MSENLIVERFWSKVDRRGDNECWPWIGARDSNGYGQIRVNKRLRHSTQVSWEIENGLPFPVGMSACHKCDTPSCVNPRHIWPGSYRDNAMDAISKGRMKFRPQDNEAWSSANALKTKCKRGHHFDPENTIVSTNGWRRCRVCRRLSYHKYNTTRRSRARTTANSDFAVMS